ncbi:MAG TPA: hypothetical protein VIX59_08975 [Candidatus Binataceae bacterium]
MIDQIIRRAKSELSFAQNFFGTFHKITDSQGSVAFFADAIGAEWFSLFEQSFCSSLRKKKDAGGIG